MFSQTLILTESYDQTVARLVEFDDVNMVRNLHPRHMPSLSVPLEAWRSADPDDPEFDLLTSAIRLQLGRDLGIVYGRTEYGRAGFYLLFDIQPNGWGTVSSVVDTDYSADDEVEAICNNPVARLRAMHPLCSPRLRNSPVPMGIASPVVDWAAYTIEPYRRATGTTTIPLSDHHRRIIAARDRERRMADGDLAF